MSAQKKYQSPVNNYKYQHNDKFVDYLQNQNLYNPEFDSQQIKMERKSILKTQNLENKGRRSMSTNNRVNSEMNSIQYSSEMNNHPLEMQDHNQSQTSLDHTNRKRIKSFLSPDYYKQNFKATQKKENQKDNALRDIEKKRLERDKALIENYFNIPLVLKTNKKVLQEQEQQSIINQSSIEDNQDNTNKQKQYIQFKQNQETYLLNNSLNKQLETHTSQSKQEKKRFILRDQLCGSPFKQMLLSKNNNNNNSININNSNNQIGTSLAVSSISTAAGSKKQYHLNNIVQQDRYSPIKQTNHSKSISMKQYSNIYNTHASKYKQNNPNIDRSFQSLHVGSSSLNKEESLISGKSVFIDEDNLDKNKQKRIQFERNSNKNIDDQNNVSPLLNSSQLSIEKYGYQEIIPYLQTNSPQNQSHDIYIQPFQQQSSTQASQCFDTNNHLKNITMISNVFDGQGQTKLIEQGIQNVQYISSPDQPPLILPIDEQPDIVYNEIYVDEKGNQIKFNNEDNGYLDQQNINKNNYKSQQEQSYFLKESFISNIAQSIKETSPQKQQNVINNSSSSNYLENSSFINGESFSILKQSKLSLNKDSYEILKNYSVQTCMDKGTHGEIFKIKNNITNKYQVAKRIPFVSKYAEQAFDNEEFVLSYFFDTYNGTIKKQFQNHAGSFKLIQTTHIEKLPNEGLFIQQSGGKSLSRSLLEIREETLKGELISHIYPTKLHQSLQTHKEQLYELIASISEVIDLLSSNKIVHSDLRMENILIETLDFGDSCAIQSVKIADFGSSFLLTNRKGISNVIPEYMPPEILQSMLGKKGHQVFKEEIPWSIDIWTLGCIIIEIIIGIPVWMPQRCLLHSHGCNPKKVTPGIFSHKDRRLDRILERQVKFANQIDLFVKQYQNQTSPRLFKIDQTIGTILQGIFKINPNERISPQKILNLLRKSNC